MKLHALIASLVLLGLALEQDYAPIEMLATGGAGGDSVASLPVVQPPQPARSEPVVVDVSDAMGCHATMTIAGNGLVFHASWKSNGATIEVTVEREEGEDMSNARDRFVREVKALQEAFPPEISAPGQLLSPPQTPYFLPHIYPHGDRPPRLEREPLGAV